MKSNPSRSGTPARAGGGRTPPARPANRPATGRAAGRQCAADARFYPWRESPEMRRVTWPSREEWISATLLTIALVVGVGIFTAACDWLFGVLFTWLTGGAR